MYKKIFRMGEDGVRCCPAKSGNALLFVMENADSLSSCLSALRWREVRMRKNGPSCRGTVLTPTASHFPCKGAGGVVVGSGRCCRRSGGEGGVAVRRADGGAGVPVASCPHRVCPITAIREDAR